MSFLDAALVARAHQDGHAYRAAQLRHRRLVAEPLVIVPEQLGAEAFSAGAIGFGTSPADLHLVVAGDPRNRDLAFHALLEFARWFNPRFERFGDAREAVIQGSREYTVATAAPQVVVPNRGSVDMLARLGRRLAYLRQDGDQPADPDLVRLGQHLLFLGRHSTYPGQQLVIGLTDLITGHWVTPQSDFDRASLGALDAHIDPAASPAWEWERQRLRVADSLAWQENRERASGAEAAAVAERFPVGPEPDGDDDTRLEELVKNFNAARAGRTAPDLVHPLISPIAAHYRPIVSRAWELAWHSLERERAWPEAPSVQRRWNEDRETYTRHLDWTQTVARWRTRQTPLQAARTLRQREDAKARLLAEEACDDPVKMIPYIMANKAIEGRVVSIDLEHREVANVVRVRRPLLILASPDPCPLPGDRELWWTGNPTGKPWLAHAVVQRADGSALVTLKLTTQSSPMPAIGDQVCFSMHTTQGRPFQRLPLQAPWTHQPPVAPPPPAPIEEDAP